MRRTPRVRKRRDEGVPSGLAPLRKETRDARNTFVGHRSAEDAGESRLDEMRRLRRFVALPDEPQFRATLEALQQVVSPVRALAVGSYGRSHVDPTTGCRVMSRSTPIRVR